MFSKLMTSVMMMAPMLDDPPAASTTFDIIQFMKNLFGYLKTIGHYLMMLAGVVLVIVAVVQIAKGLAGGGRGQVNWVMSIACLLVGGLLIFGGWNMATSVASIGYGTIDQISSGSYEQTATADGGGSKVGNQMSSTGNVTQ